jgi:exopolyphosphatase/guanosine-5'-triphosphate,3'-diphosphate pyrophosphatase
MAGHRHSMDARAETIRRLMQQYSVDVEQAQRVEKLALTLLESVKDSIATPYEMARRLLIWASRLHEIGFVISHNGYHKHSAYVIDNGDFQGFSRQEQKLLSFLVLNHRRKFKILPSAYGFNPDWRLIQLFRLACLFCRRRDDAMVPLYVELGFSRDKCRVGLAGDWLDTHPLTVENLHEEAGFLAKQDLQLQIARF